MSALATVEDPEIRRPITDLGMVDSVEINDGVVVVTVLLTVSGCPMKTEIIQRVTAAASEVPGVTDVQVKLDVMSDEQRTALREQLRGPTKEIPFNRPGSLTKIFAYVNPTSYY